MTTPSAEPTNAASLPTVGPAAPEQALTPDALLRDAVEAAGLTADEVGELKILARFALGDVTWTSNAPAPNREDLWIVAMFEGPGANLAETYAPGDIRIYVAPVGPANVAAKQWLLYTLNRVQPVGMTVSQMGQEGFVGELAVELQSLAGIRDAIGEDNDTLRDALEKIRSKADETTTAAMIRCSSIVGLVDEALKELDADEDGEEESE